MKLHDRKEELITLIEEQNRFGIAFDDEDVKHLMKLTCVELLFINKIIMQTVKINKERWEEQNVD